MGSWGLMSYHNLMGIYQNRKGMIRFFIISHHHPMGKMIMDKMDEVIKSIKDEKPTSSGEKSCNDNESNASTMTNGEVRWSEISPSELTPAQLERMGVRLHLTPGVMRFHEDLVRSLD